MIRAAILPTIVFVGYAYAMLWIFLSWGGI